MNRSGRLIAAEGLDRSGTTVLLGGIARWLERTVEIDRVSVATGSTTRLYEMHDRRAGREWKQPLAPR